eukprot:COSAG05_NODE_1389_length_5003_cov_4.929853_1_plen_249_part_00
MQAACCAKPPKGGKGDSQTRLCISSTVPDEGTQLQAVVEEDGGCTDSGEDEARLRRFDFLREFGVDHYCRQLGPLTHRTVLVGVGMEEARALVDAISPDGAWYRRIDMAALSGFRSRLDAAISGIKRTTGRGAFVRLPLHSPTDATCRSGSAWQRSVALLRAALNDRGRYNDDDGSSERMSPEQLAYGALLGGLEVQSGADAMDLLMCSRRVQLELLAALEYPLRFNLHIAVRCDAPRPPCLARCAPA